MKDAISKKIHIKIKPKSAGLILKFLNEEVKKMKIPSNIIVEGEAPLETIKGELESIVRELEQEILKSHIED